MSDGLLWAFVAIVVLGGVARGFSKPSRPTMTPTTDDSAAQDFALFRDSVSDQESRIDALDSSLGALNALLFAILSYLPEHRTSGTHLTIEHGYGVTASILLVLAIAASLFAAIAFRSAEVLNSTPYFAVASRIAERRSRQTRQISHVIISGTVASSGANSRFFVFRSSRARPARL